MNIRIFREIEQILVCFANCSMGYNNDVSKWAYQNKIDEIKEKKDKLYFNFLKEL